VVLVVVLVLAPGKGEHKQQTVQANMGPKKSVQKIDIG
jgi:hypothetical protein